jgi:peroxiredoxin
MVSVGQQAPDFTAPVVAGEIEDFTLSDRMPTEAPLILAFFPGPFTEVCTNEMVAFRDQRASLAEHGATLYGVHTDTPASLQAFREEYSLGFGLLSDTPKEIVEAYGVRENFEEFGLYGVPDRAVFVVDDNREIVYKWIADDPANEPEYEAIREAVKATT